MRITDVQTVVLCSTCLSLVSSLCILATFFIDKTWRRELFNAKFLLFVMSASLLNIDVDKPHDMCLTQAVFIQLFSLPVFFHEAFIAFDAYLIISGMCYSPDVDAEIVDEDSSFFEYVPKRYLYFEVISLIFSIVAVLFLVAFDLAEPSDTVPCMCYTNDLAFGLVCFFGPVIVCLMILAFYNVRTIRRVLFLFDYSGDDSLREIYKRLDPKSKNMFCRICIIPFCYLISLTPLIMYHMLLLFGLRRADDTVAAVVSSFLSISGICNFVLWVLFDEHARNSWWEWLSGGGVSCEEDRDSESILFAVVERGSYLRGKGHSVQGGLMTVKNNGIRLSRQSRPSLALRDLSSVSAAVVTNPLR